MKKLFLLLLLAIGLISVSYADYLDDWPDEAYMEANTFSHTGEVKVVAHENR